MNKIMFRLLLIIPYFIVYIAFIYTPNNADLIPQILNLSKAASYTIKKNNVSVNTSSEDITKLINNKAPDLLKPLAFYDYSFQPIYINNTFETIINVYKKNLLYLKILAQHQTLSMKTQSNNGIWLLFYRSKLMLENWFTRS